MPYSSTYVGVAVTGGLVTNVSVLNSVVVGVDVKDGGAGSGVPSDGGRVIFAPPYMSSADGARVRLAPPSFSADGARVILAPPSMSSADGARVILAPPSAVSEGARVTWPPPRTPWLPGER